MGLCAADRSTVRGLSIYALTFIIVPVLAYFFAGEPLTLRTLAGAAVIMLGVLISVR